MSEKRKPKSKLPPGVTQVPVTRDAEIWKPMVMELVALAINERADVLNFRVPDVVVDEINYGSFEVSVRRIV